MSSVAICVARAFVVALLLHLAIAHTIKNVVVLMEENRSFDHIFGFRNGVDGVKPTMCNQVNLTNASKGRVCVTNRSQQVAIGRCDPDHTFISQTYKIFGAIRPNASLLQNATMCGFAALENWKGNNASNNNYCGVMDMFPPSGMPIMNALADNFVLMDRFFSSFPGSTWPNRLFFLSGTSQGFTGAQDPLLGRNGKLFSQKTIYDQITQANGTWRHYINDTIWEGFVATIANNPNNVKNTTTFFADARSGTLPTFAFINPRMGPSKTQGSNDMHPDHDVSLGEQLIKDIYEALRASPQWFETLFIVTFDENGGFYDHVAPPTYVAPPGDGFASYPVRSHNFDRGGIRIPTLLISSWVPKGMVLSEPPAFAKPQNTSRYELTSIMSSVRRLLGIQNVTGPLTLRDAWAATFDHVFNLTQHRRDCPKILPPIFSSSTPTQTAAQQGELPINALQQGALAVNAHLAGEPYPDHIALQAHVADENHRLSEKHREATLEWLHSKNNRNVVVRCAPINDANVEGAHLASSWAINENNDPKYVILSVNVTMDKQRELCLDASNRSAGVSVSMSRCHPSANPVYNRDSEQHFTFGVDGTIRPLEAQELCVSNTCSAGSTMQSSVTLQLCTPGAVEQRWSYHGFLGGLGLIADSGTTFALVVDVPRHSRTSRHSDSLASP